MESLSLSVCLFICLQILVQPITFFCFYIGLPYLAIRYIIMRQCVTCIHDPNTMLTCDLKVKFIGFFYMFSCRARNYFLLWHWLPLFSTWFYHHKSMCCIHSWSWYNIDLWPQDQIYMVFGMTICSDHSFFVLLRHHILFGTWVYTHWTMCNIFSWSLYDLDLWPQYQNYIFSPWICFALWHKHTKHVVYFHLFSTKLGIKNLWVKGK